MRSTRLQSFWLLLLLAAAGGCAHRPLTAQELEQVYRPAFISRIVEGAGPTARVFQEDSAYGGKLKKLEPKEADRRLTAKLRQVSRFEVSERLRGTALALLPDELPWSRTLEPVAVASALQSFLVEEVPANAPDYALLEPLGADAIVEFVIEDFGMRSDDGRAGVYVSGYARMFRMDGAQLWHRRFYSDQVKARLPHLDPFRVGKDPDLFRTELRSVLDAIAAFLAKDLIPPEPLRRRPSHPPDAAEPRAQPKVAPVDDLPPGELPPPDP